MKKNILWSIVMASLVLLLLLPGLLGQAAERTLRAQVAASASAEQPLSLRITRYDRGWFASTVVYELGLAEDLVAPLPSLAAAPGSDNPLAQRLELVSAVRHGPVGLHQGLFFGLFAAVTTPAESNPAINDFVATTGMPQLFQVVTHTGFGGATQFAVTVPPVNADGTDIGQPLQTGALRFAGLQATGSVAAGGEAITLAAAFDALAIAGEEAELRVEGFALAGSTEKISQSLWLGPVTLALARIDLRSKGAAPSLSAAGLEWSLASATQPGAELADMAVTLKAQQLQAAGQNLANAQLTLSLRSLSVAALDAYAQLTAAQQTDASQRLEWALPGLLHQFAAQSPVLAIAPLAFTLDGASFTGTAELQLDGAQLPASSDPTAASRSGLDLAQWLALVNMDAAVQIAKPLAERFASHYAQSQLTTALAADSSVDPAQIEAMARLQAPLLLQSLVDQGTLTEQSDSYAATAVFGDGELLLNGQRLPLGVLLSTLF